MPEEMTDIVERLKDADNATHALFNYIFQDARKEIERLRAKIEAMEKQKPVAWMNSRNGFICKENKNPEYNVPLYALPGAQGEEK